MAYETVSFVAVNSGTSSVSVPGSAEVGDMLLAIAQKGSNGAPSIPSGWTLLGTTASDRKARAYSKICTLSDIGASISVGSSTCKIAVFRGVEQSTPSVAVGTVNRTTATTSGGITTTIEDTHLCILASGDAGGSTYPAFSGQAIVNNNPTWTEHADSRGASDAASSVASANYTTFLQDTGNASVNYSRDVFSSGGIFLVELKPAGIVAANNALAMCNF